MATPVRKPRRDTADMLSWPEIRRSDSPATPSPAHRSHQPSDGISKVLHGGQITEEEAQSLNKKKPCSGYKMKEITGSGIFAGEGNAEAPENPGRVYHQAVNAMSQISFSVDEHVTPKKPTSIPEVAKQRELCGNLKSELDSKTQKGVSKSKTRELSGNDIFGPPPEIVPRSVNAVGTHEYNKSPKDSGEPAPRNVRTSVKVSNPAGGQSKILFTEDPVVKTSKKIHNQKFAELTGNDIFKGDVLILENVRKNLLRNYRDVSPGSAEKPISTAKMREMSGSNIFADGKAASRDYLGGVRKPPGGESSISLV